MANFLVLKSVLAIWLINSPNGLRHMKPRSICVIGGVFLFLLGGVYEEMA